MKYYKRNDGYAYYFDTEKTQNLMACPYFVNEPGGKELDKENEMYVSDFEAEPLNENEIADITFILKNL